MVMILALCIPLTAFVVGVLVLKAVHMGLKWQYEIKREEKPSMEVKNPVSEILQNTQEQKQVQEMQSIFSEWIDGPKEVSK